MSVGTWSPFNRFLHALGQVQGRPEHVGIPTQGHWSHEEQAFNHARMCTRVVGDDRRIVRPAEKIAAIDT